MSDFDYLNPILKGLIYGLIAGAIIVAFWFILSEGPMSFIQNNPSLFSNRALAWLGLFYYTCAGAVVGSIVGFIVGAVIAVTRR